MSDDDPPMVYRSGGRYTMFDSFSPAPPRDHAPKEKKKWEMRQSGSTVWVDEGAICVAELPANEDGQPQVRNGRAIAALPDLISALFEALEFVESQQDVVDGSDGPVANRAMQLTQTISAAIEKAGGTV
jgi:hypothetical protein